jgi:hypothetical protein
VDEGKFLGSVVTSFVSRGWPFDSLTISQESLRFKSFAQETEVKRADASTVEFHKQRFPLMMGTYVVVRLVGGTVQERMFTPWQVRAVRQALETHGWPTEDRKVTARQTLTAPRPE